MTTPSIMDSWVDQQNGLVKCDDQRAESRVLARGTPQLRLASKSRKGRILMRLVATSAWGALMLSAHPASARLSHPQISRRRYVINLPPFCQRKRRPRRRSPWVRRAAEADIEVAAPGPGSIEGEAGERIGIRLRPQSRRARLAPRTEIDRGPIPSGEEDGRRLRRGAEPEQ